MTISTDDLRPADFAAVVSVEYDLDERVDQRGAVAHGLDADTADELATAIMLGVDDVTAAGKASQELHGVANSLIKTLHTAHSRASVEARNAE